MSAQVIKLTEGRLNVQEYQIEWKLSNLFSLGTKSLRTPVFSPLPDVEVGLYFEMWYEQLEITPYGDRSSSFKLSLKKNFCGDVPETLKTIVLVDVLYHDRHVFKEYSPSGVLGLKEMISYDFEVVITGLVFDYQYQSEHQTRLNVENGTLILKCCFGLVGHPSFIPNIHMDSSTPSSLELFAKDFRSVYSPCVLSDVKFIFEDKSLPAHKSVLAAHSPVFLKMFTQDFLKSKTDSFTFADTTRDNFENFLKYLYSGEIEDKSLRNIQNLSYLAKKYDVRSLRGECAKSAETLLSTENVIDILILVYESHELETFARVKQYAASHIEELFSTERWNNLLASHPVICYEVMTHAYRTSDISLQNETSTI